MANPNAFPVTQPVNRLRGSLPKIGIRPCIDGRRKGVREGLEELTMSLARAAAKFLSENLRHSCGLPVECVIADTTIGGFKEAADCAEKFARENVGVSITVTPCWCYGSETMDMDPFTPKAIWGFNGTERPGAVYLAAVLAAHSQKGLPAFGIYGHDVQDIGMAGTIPDDVKEKLLRFAKAGLAVATMRGKAYLSMGGTAMGIAGSIVNPELFEKYLGMRCESIDMSEFVRRWDEGIYDPEEFARAEKWVKENITFGWDKNPDEVKHDDARKEEVLKTCIKMVMIGRDLMIGNPKLAEMGFVEESCGHNAIAGGFQGQRQWTDHFPNGDFMESLLNSSYDWNGIREPFVVATENDALNGVCMLLGKLLTNTASGFADVRTYWSPEAVERVTGWKPEGMAANGFIHLINSGAVTLDATGQCEIDGKPAMKHWWDITSEEAAKCVENTQYCYADLFYFRGGGYSSHLVSRGGMPVTMTRMNMIDGLGPVLQIAEGWTVELPKEVHDTLDKRTDPTWPTTWFVPRLTGKDAFTDVYSVMNNWGANHGAFNYGHIGADLITMASMLRIPVAMHNVEDSKIFRPSTWGAFGTKDLEGADYRACQNFGPLYGKKK
ncbi:MAG TPA: L-fucose isomerase [Candidatus Faecaligallichristensenella faecipullorum]|nr:L-fucose isomerase [Candidatus Faecaligallichristensenella faecipullorum]